MPDRATPDPVTPDWLRALLERHGVTQQGAARMLRTDDRTVRRWLAGDRACDWRSAELLRRLVLEQAQKP